MPLTLRWSSTTTLPADARGLDPETLAGLSASEVARRPIRLGNGSAEVGELFDVSGEPAADHLAIEGDLRRVRGIGAGMGSGLLTVRGDAGMHLGAGMSGGTIEIEGSVADGAAVGMRGGTLRIRGAAGDDLGGAGPGERVGMRDGVILIDGPVGDGAGLAMRRGLIAVSGRAGADLGQDMIAGSIFAFGPVGPRAGAGMKRGTLACFGLGGNGDGDWPPTFRPSGRYRPPVATVYLRQLRDWGFPVPDHAFAGTFRRYNGDLLARGRAEIWAWTAGEDHR